MIDNIILLITGTLHNRAISELLPKCHPLGTFEELGSLGIAQTAKDLYNAVLVDTPLGELAISATTVGLCRLLFEVESCNIFSYRRPVACNVAHHVKLWQLTVSLSV